MEKSFQKEGRDGDKAKKQKTKNKTQLWMRSVMEVKSDAVKSDIT